MRLTNLETALPLSYRSQLFSNIARHACHLSLRSLAVSLNQAILYSASLSCGPSLEKSPGMGKLPRPQLSIASIISKYPGPGPSAVVVPTAVATGSAQRDR